jgi:hypothetical protein
MRTSRTVGQWKPTAIRVLLYVSFVCVYVCFLHGLGPCGWPFLCPRSRTNTYQEKPNSFIS